MNVYFFKTIHVKGEASIKEAVETVRPYGVDVAGGVGRETGKKYYDKVRRFVEGAREG